MDGDDTNAATVEPEAGTTPLSDAERDAMRSMLDDVRGKTDGFRSRRAQLQMIADVARILTGDAAPEPIGLIEAQTGTGKSLAYLIPAIALALHRQRKVVVSTRTVALQQQLVDRDLPALVEAAGLDITFRIAKGRARYACPYRMEQYLGDVAQGTLFEDDDAAGDDGESLAAVTAVIQSMDDALRAETWSGDLDHWPERIDASVNRRITVDQHRCLGSKCPKFSACPYFTERNRVRDATVVVANHSLVLSDVSLGGGTLLPPPEDTFHIVDEGHNFAEVATGHNSFDLDGKAAREMLGGLSRDARDVAESAMPGNRVEPTARKLAESGGEAHAALRDFAHAVDRHLRDHGERRGDGALYWLLDGEALPDDITTTADQLAATAQALTGAVETLQAGAQSRISSGELSPAQGTQLQERIGALLTQLEGIQGVARAYAQPDPADAPPVARWATLGSDGVNAYACPTSAAAWLRGQFWSKVAGAVVTSATLAAGDDFTRTRIGLGLPREAFERQLPSPFDFQRISRLNIVRLPASAAQRDAHIEAVIQELPHRVALEEGTLVLFTARRQMERTAEALRETWGDALICQGDASHHEVLRRHRARIEAGQGSVLFGLASFAEGVDLPGAQCRHVVITKLPFAVPDGPVDKTYSDWLEKRGRNPFMEVAIPNTAIKLKQQCGRLIRNEDDYGTVTLMDERVLTKRYGPLLLAGLPFPRQVESGGGGG
ncbi:ATP-dependent DNA helicase DinG [Aquisalimonas asiatica]|uniref:ATP-dependent DNA helicase DinG n=1 Tax=Aquisalimonas asiatica TaxID=406100 RepID=A0A1H8S746_9GAMM|nr:ATP-dependent DNA helicase DinG [Aquisalimonas asiatica]SEO74224.1 ATP-dependent DNA helicase DinG [Aquisalimonas asiatica]